MSFCILLVVLIFHDYIFYQMLFQGHKLTILFLVHERDSCKFLTAPLLDGLQYSYPFY